jgi:phosphoglycerate dehydrogenase-like enzyme
MTDAAHIVALFKSVSVPPAIRAALGDAVPPGYRLSLCDDTADPGHRRALVAEADYLLVYAVPFEDLDVAGRVRLLQLLSAGYDRIDLAALKAAGIPVADNGGANAPTVAEHALLLILCVLRRLPLHHQSLQDGQWIGQREGLGLRELGGKQLGIVGFGRIGQGVARMARAFQTEVAYCDEEPASEDLERSLGVRRVALAALLAESDIVSLHTPLTARTRHLIDAAALARMKRGAVLINTSRGPVVDEAALVRSLNEGHLGGAGLDVFEHEPIDGEHPLLGRDNVVVTPHVAGTTRDTWTRRIEFALGNVQRVAAGQAPLSVVNP